MFKFRLLAGSHTEAGKVFRSRESGKNIVESENPLDEMFVNKFERIGGRISEGSKKSADTREDDDPQGNDDIARDPQILLDPDRREAGGKKLPRRAERGGTDGAPPNDLATRRASQLAPKDEDDEDEPEGEDVSADFDLEEGSSRRVVKNGRKYDVYDGSEKENSEPMTKKEVKTFLKEMDDE